MSLISKAFGNTNTGLIGSINKATGMNQLGVNAKAPAPAVTSTPTLAPKMTMAAPTTGPKMTYAVPRTTTTIKSKVDQNVLAQQKALNAQGAGLVEDGIMGPKTQAALSKYSAPQQNQQQAPQQNNNFLNELNNWQPQAQATSTGPDVSNTGLLTSLASQGAKTGTEYQALNQKLIDLKDKLAKSKADQAASVAATKSEAIPIEFQTGRANVLSDKYRAEQQAIADEMSSVSNQLGAANTQQGLQQQATSTALGYTQPQFQFGMLTNPQTGQIVGGGGSTASGVMQSALQNAYNMYRNGASVGDIMATSGLDTFGVLGKNALINMINGGGSNFNPTAYNTQVGTNMQNLAQTQQQAYQTNLALEQIKQLSPMVTNFLSKSGMNPYDAQIYNGPVNDYIAKVGGSGKAAQWAAQMTELKNYTSGLIASGYAGTPTGNEAMTLSQDPSKLSYKDLQAYLKTLEDLGANRQYVLQSQLRNVGGTGVGYTGSQASPVSSTGVATPGVTGFGTGITSPGGQFAAGAALGTLPGLASAATQGGVFAIGKKLLEKLGL